MSAVEQLWFAVGVGGFTLLLEAVVTLIVKVILRRRAESYKEKMRDDIIEGIAKSSAGLVMFIIALIKLFALSPK